LQYITLHALLVKEWELYARSDHAEARHTWCLVLEHPVAVASQITELLFKVTDHLALLPSTLAV
jgi:hypothetical protein